jgi:hypothetical protein
LATDDLAKEIYGSGLYFMNREKYNTEQGKRKEGGENLDGDTSLKTSDPQSRYISPQVALLRRPHSWFIDTVLVATAPWVDLRELFPKTTHSTRGLNGKRKKFGIVCDGKHPKPVNKDDLAQSWKEVSRRLEWGEMLKVPYCLDRRKAVQLLERRVKVRE